MGLDFGVALYNKIKASTDIVAVIGARLFRVEAPEGTATPLVVFSIENFHNIKIGDYESSLEEVSVRVACATPNLADSIALRELVKTAITVGDYSTGGGEILVQRVSTAVDANVKEGDNWISVLNLTMIKES